MLKNASFSAELKESFYTLITKHTGLVIRESDRNSFHEKICSRINSLNISSPSNYYEILNSSTLESYQEWEKLIFLLTNNESYFFRDKEQLNVLKNHIFSQLIERQKNQKTIRICSAGCSTGQEPYTLAIILKELLPDFEQWNIQILGIDIDHKTLEVARLGIYEPWSFRGVSEDIKQKYFRCFGDRYQLIPEIKQLVKFQTVNLVKDVFPQPYSQLRQMDLIICRNVFIYFKNPTITQIVDKFYQTLKPSGYFLTGHTELSGLNLDKFHKLFFPESIVYQRPSNLSNEIKDKTVLTQKSKPIDFFPEAKKINPDKELKAKKISKTVYSSDVIYSSLTLKDKLLEAENLFLEEDYEFAVKKAQAILEQDSEYSQAFCLLAKIYSNLGQYGPATEACQKAIKINFSALEPHYLLAKIAEEKGDYLEAKRVLKQIIYLEPNSVDAYLDLSHIYQVEGDLKRSEKMKESALKLAS